MMLATSWLPRYKWNVAALRPRVLPEVSKGAPFFTIFLSLIQLN
jgi:hypothetical protein